MPWPTTRYAACRAVDSCSSVLDTCGGHDQRAVRSDPTFAAAWLNGGNALKAMGRYSEARSMYRQALALDTENVDAYDIRPLLSCPSTYR